MIIHSKQIRSQEAVWESPSLPCFFHSGFQLPYSGFCPIESSGEPKHILTLKADAKPFLRKQGAAFGILTAKIKCGRDSHHDPRRAIRCCIALSLWLTEGYSLYNRHRSCSIMTLRREWPMSGTAAENTENPKHDNEHTQQYSKNSKRQNQHCYHSILCIQAKFTALD